MKFSKTFVYSSAPLYKNYPFHDLIFFKEEENNLELILNHFLFFHVIFNRVVFIYVILMLFSISNVTDFVCFFFPPKLKFPSFLSGLTFSGPVFSFLRASLQFFFILSSFAISVSVFPLAVSGGTLQHRSLKYRTSAATHARVSSLLCY